MGRPSRGEELDSRKVSLPKVLWDWIDSRESNALTGKPLYGSRTRFFERLIREERNRVLSLTASLAVPNPKKGDK